MEELRLKQQSSLSMPFQASQKLRADSPAVAFTGSSANPVFEDVSSTFPGPADCIFLSMDDYLLTQPLARPDFAVCGAQCKMKTSGFWFKKHEEFQDANSRAFRPKCGALPRREALCDCMQLAQPAARYTYHASSLR